jgi:hypothetical protein
MTFLISLSCFLFQTRRGTSFSRAGSHDKQQIGAHTLASEDKV